MYTLNKRVLFSNKIDSIKQKYTLTVQSFLIYDYSSFPINLYAACGYNSLSELAGSLYPETAGSIQPNSFYNAQIQSLYSTNQNITYLFLSTKDFQCLMLTRLDTNASILLAYNTSKSAYTNSSMFFTDQDYNKSIDIIIEPYYNRN